MQQEIRAFFHIPAHQITTIPNGVSSFRNAEQADLATNPLLADVISNCVASSRILVSLGRLVFEKGVHTLLAAMPLVLARFPEALLIIAGEGPERQSLEAIAAPVQERVMFTGFLDEADKYASFASG